ncbi:protein containing Sulphatase-modifying factor [Candidatus Magnetomorum sp. HK-1]|nr:protein containing Sulphatase-modifying factor [Candidatus Magnetomorum sp. HK-1]
MYKFFIYAIIIIIKITILNPLYASIVVTTIEGQNLLLYEHSYALVVGNSDYKNFNKLPGAKQDAVEVSKALERKGFTVKLALNLSREKFNNLFTDFTVNRCNKEKSRILFYYAGHGYTLPMAGGETMGYLVMIDTPDPDKNRAGFLKKSIDMQYMVLKSQQMLSRHVLYMFDSCFSGTILNFRSQSKPAKVSQRVKYPVRQFITAGGAKEEVPDKSFFKQVFLDLIEGRVEEPFKDGYITGEELGFYLSAQVPYYFDYQHPRFGKIKNPKLDKGDFIFLAGGVTHYEEPGTGTLEIDTTTVPGMKIEIFNKSGQCVYQGKGDTKIDDLIPGRYTIRAKAPGYEDKRKTISVHKDRKARVSFILELLKGRIFVDAEPSDAQIRILHMPPRYYQGMVLPPGEYELEASHSGYYQLNKWVTLHANEDLTVDMKLQLKKGIIPPQIPVIRKKEVQYIQQGRTFTNQFGMTFVLIPSGSFMMGSPKNESERSDEIQHQVTLTQNYYMQITEVTQGQWQKVMGNNPSYFKDCGASCPVENISWNDVQGFIKQLNKMDSSKNYRLPTEAEWEYAARAGTKTRFFWGNQPDCSRANYGNGWSDECKSINPGKTKIVKSYSSNNWGLYDMHGNVWEWCQDRYGDYSKRDVIDPTGSDTGSLRVFRGGSWNCDASYCRSALRYWHWPESRRNYLGFRLCAPGR